MLKNAKNPYAPDQYISEGQFKLDASDPADMDAKATAVEMAKRGDPEGAIQFLTLYKAMDSVKPIVIPSLTFCKKGREDRTISQNASAVIDALIKSGWQVK